MLRGRLTSVSNAGTELDDLLLMDKMQDGGGLRIRIYAMLAASQANIERIASRGPLLKDRLTARSFKMYADGALGSRGAYLLEPYADDPTNRGLLTLNPKELERVCGIASENGFQMNVHAIGDAAVRLVLDVYEKFLSPATISAGESNTRRLFIPTTCVGSVNSRSFPRPNHSRDFRHGLDRE